MRRCRPTQQRTCIQCAKATFSMLETYHSQAPPYWPAQEPSAQCVCRGRLGPRAVQSRSRPHQRGTHQLWRGITLGEDCCQQPLELGTAGGAGAGKVSCGMPLRHVRTRDPAGSRPRPKIDSDAALDLGDTPLGPATRHYGRAVNATHHHSSPYRPLARDYEINNCTGYQFKSLNCVQGVKYSTWRQHCLIIPALRSQDRPPEQPRKHAECIWRWIVARFAPQSSAPRLPGMPTSFAGKACASLRVAPPPGFKVSNSPCASCCATCPSNPPGD